MSSLGSGKPGPSTSSQPSMGGEMNKVCSVSCDNRSPHEQGLALWSPRTLGAAAGSLLLIATQRVGLSKGGRPKLRGCVSPSIEVSPADLAQSAFFRLTYR